jgi:hypothetical protein
MWKFNGMFIFSVVLTISFALGLAISFATINTNIKLKNDRLITSVFGLTSVFILQGVDACTDSNDKCLCYGNIIGTLMLRNELKHIKEYYDSNGFTIQEYLTIVSCFIKRAVSPKYHLCIDKKLLRYPEFLLLEVITCPVYCNEERSRLPCVYDAPLDVDRLVIKTFKAAEAFAQYKHNYPSLYAEEIKEKWELVSSYIPKLNNFSKKELDDVDKCVMIDMQMKMYCDLQSIIFS